MKTSVCLAAVIALVVIQMGNAQETTKKTTDVTLSCKEVMCRVGCERVLGSDGCPICDCQANCTAVTCLIVYESEKGVLSCFQEFGSESNTTCAPIANSAHCPMFQCGGDGSGCYPMIGPNGCPICECPVTCKDINCTEDEECVVEVIECERYPCFTRPTCVPRSVVCMGTPNTSLCRDANDTEYRWSYNESTHSCQNFSYYGCTPSPNTFKSRVACEDFCRPSSACEVCDDGCFRLKKMGQFTKCICPDPCKDFNCTVGEVCRLTDACVRPPCKTPLQPYCVKNPCPEPEQCGIKCMKSLKVDDNGCQLCECCDHYIPGWIGN